ncbi:MAG: hypothetical protein K2N13_08145 [Paraprevotella sp.]|nr:hypothetical protein [Paraprevotella sp.]
MRVMRAEDCHPCAARFPGRQQAVSRVGNYPLPERSAVHFPNGAHSTWGSGVLFTWGSGVLFTWGSGALSAWGGGALSASGGTGRGQASCETGRTPEARQTASGVRSNAFYPGIAPAEHAVPSGTVYFRYSPQSVSRMSPLRVNVSCMAKAADRQ